MESLDKQLCWAELFEWPILRYKVQKSNLPIFFGIFLRIYSTSFVLDSLGSNIMVFF